MAWLTVITTPDLAPGFALTGAQVLTATTAAEAEPLLRRQLVENPDAVIALHAPFYQALPDDLKERVQSDYRPLVVPLPNGLPPRPGFSPRQQLRELVSRIVGYSIRFPGEPES